MDRLRPCTAFLLLATVALLAGGCTALFGFETPSAAASDAGVMDGPGRPDGGGDIPDAHPLPIDANLPDAHGNPIMTLALGQTNIQGLALDLNGIYWSTMDGMITRANKDGAGPTVLTPGPVAPEGHMFVQNGFVYWATREFQAPFRLYRSSTGGGGANTRILGAINSPNGFYVDGTGITYNAGLDVSQAMLDGTNQHQVWPITTNSFQLTRDSLHAFWSVYGETNGEISQILMSTGQEKILATGLTEPGMLLADGTRVYWVNFGMRDPAGGGVVLAHTGSVMMAAVDDPNPHVIASGESFMRVIAIDSSFIYWASFDSSAILRRAKDGTGAIDFIAQPSSTDVRAMAVDDDFVFWATSSTIERAPKTPH